jgi:hypothetical protein
MAAALLPKLWLWVELRGLGMCAAAVASLSVKTELTFNSIFHLPKSLLITQLVLKLYRLLSLVCPVGSRIY